MEKKWYFGALITAFALFVGIQQQNLVPNQEIVLEFSDIEVTSLEAQNAIAIVKKQLKSIGVQHTTISKNLKEGKLTITYYSDANVAYIKKMLAKEQGVVVDHISYDKDENDDPFSSNKSIKDYSFDVHEIQENTDFDFNNTYVLEVQYEQEGNVGPNVCHFLVNIDTNDIDVLVKVAQKVNTSIAIAIDNTSYKIPEVRAGPVS